MMFNSKAESTQPNPILTSLRNWKNHYESSDSEYPREIVSLAGILKVEIAFAMDAMEWTDNLKGINNDHVDHAKKIMEKLKAFESKD